MTGRIRRGAVALGSILLAASAAAQPLRIKADPRPVDPAHAREWSAYDDACLTGPFTLRFRVIGSQGEPAHGRNWQLIAGGLMPGEPPARVVAEGKLPPDGTVEVTGLAGIEKEISAEELKRQRRFAPWFSVFAEGKRLGHVSFFEWGEAGEDGTIKSFLPPATGNTLREAEYRLPPDKGDLAPDVTLTDLATSRPMRLSDLRGRLVLLEFWSSKCHSCEDLMQKNEELLARRAGEWQGKAVLLAASLDSDPDHLRRYLETKGWNHIRHTWSGEGGTGRYSKAAEAFVITGTPAALLISPDGRIVWRGNPAQLRLEEVFDAAAGLSPKK